MTIATLGLATRVRRAGYAWLTFLLGACAGEPSGPSLERGDPSRSWIFYKYLADRTDKQPVSNFNSQVGGTVDDSHEYGPQEFVIRGDGSATGSVFSNATGETYWALAQGPKGSATDETSTIGNNVELNQVQSFRKLAPDATLTLTVTALTLEGIDNNPNEIISFECSQDPENCDPTMMAGVELEVLGYGARGLFFEARSQLELYFNTSVLDVEPWVFTIKPGSVTQPRLFQGARDFDLDLVGTEASVRLSRPIPIVLDLSKVDSLDEFTVRIQVIARTYNLKQRESYVAAFFRDPVSSNGTVVTFTGLEPTSNPILTPPSFADFGAAPPCTGGSNAAAGMLEFSSDRFRVPELPIGGTHEIQVVRTGGTTGAVSATVTTSDGTAVAGADYTAGSAVVAFADGDAESKTVTVPVNFDQVIEPNKTVNVGLSDPRGCASLGRSNAVLTIADDDTPLPQPQAFTIGGTITGLVGSGLVLRNLPTGEDLPAGNGPFSFAQASPDRLGYDVTVGAQPTNPTQVCTVTNGSGTVAGAPVTDIAVDCITPTNGGLDPAFGGDGIVQTPLTGAGGGEVVLQPDGKIVVAGFAEVGSSDDFALTRYNADGSLDAGFGAGGTITTDIAPGSRDEGLDLAMQSDGRIVVVGRSAGSGAEFDFAVARYTANGSLDPSFGGDGTVTTDFGAGIASARSVVIQPDDRILVVGDFGSDFALARYNSDGSLDPTFGSGGTTTTDAGFVGHAVALLPDGRFVVAGGGSIGIEKDFAVARFNADGTPDAAFGTNGRVTTDIGGVDEAFEVVVQPDGRIVAAGTIDALPGAIGVDFALARYNTDGSLDAGFGGDGTVTTNFSAGRDRGAGLARQSDGKLVMVGLTTSGSFAFNNFALARYLPDGTLDSSFGVGGKLAIDVAGGNAAAEGLGIQADGRIVAAGTTSGGGGVGFAVVRVLP